MGFNYYGLPRSTNSTNPSTPIAHDQSTHYSERKLPPEWQTDYSLLL